MKKRIIFFLVSVLIVLVSSIFIAFAQESEPVNSNENTMLTICDMVDFNNSANAD